MEQRGEQMGKLLALLALGAGAYAWWREKKRPRCLACDKRVRIEARTCPHCGELLREEGPTIQVQAEKV